MIVLYENYLEVIVSQDAFLMIKKNSRKKDKKKGGISIILWESVNLCTEFGVGEVMSSILGLNCFIINMLKVVHTAVMSDE